MNDPHVVSLHYVVEPGEGVVFENPPDVVVSKPEFELQLHEGRVTAQMLVHCKNQHEAQSIVEPFLRAWEVESALTGGGQPQLSFTFERTDIIDRNPPPPGTAHIELGAVTLSGHAVVSAIGQAVRRTYPAYPVIRVTAEIETLWFRYSLYKQNRDSLTSMAYFCLTYLEFLGGSRGAAARKFAIAIAVFDTLARLVSSVGDTATPASGPEDWTSGHIQRENYSGLMRPFAPSSVGSESTLLESHSRR